MTLNERKILLCGRKSLRETDVACYVYWPEDFRFTYLPIKSTFVNIFKVPIQAIRAVNELVRTLAAVRARLHPKGQTTPSPDLVETFEWNDNVSHYNVIFDSDGK